MSFIMILVICYIVVALIRTTRLANEWLPLISGSLGIGLSVLAFYVAPSITSCDTISQAIYYGFFCGLSATGSNQVFKQAVKYIKNKFGVELYVPTVSTDETGE